MDLHPRETLEATLGRHAEAFGLLHGCLDLAIQAACSKWVDMYADIREVHGNVLAGTVRQCLFRHLRCPEFEESTLDANSGPNCSIVLSDSNGEVSTVRKHPRSYLTGQLLPVSYFPVETLFGTDYSACPWQPYVLWDADLGTQVLRHAWLAAVAHIDGPGSPVIYCRLDLPSAIMPEIIPPTVDAPDEDNWGDAFGEENTSGGPA
jgi:hypothetical protein